MLPEQQIRRGNSDNPTITFLINVTCACFFACVLSLTSHQQPAALMLWVPLRSTSTTCLFGKIKQINQNYPPDSTPTLAPLPLVTQLSNHSKTNFPVPVDKDHHLSIYGNWSEETFAGENGTKHKITINDLYTLTKGNNLGPMAMLLQYLNPF